MTLFTYKIIKKCHFQSAQVLQIFGPVEALPSLLETVGEFHLMAKISRVEKSSGSGNLVCQQANGNSNQSQWKNQPHNA